MSKIMLYVDGACRGNPGAGGWGVYMQQADRTQQFCGGELKTTNNRMELTAAIEGILLCPKDVPIQIWTDSNYVYQGITQWIHGWKKKNWKDVKNPDLWQILDEVCQGRHLDWQWIKGHAGHHGNEMADQLANRGVDAVLQQADLQYKVLDANQDLKILASVRQFSSSNPTSVNNKNNQPSIVENDWLNTDPFGLDWDEESDELEHEPNLSSEYQVEEHNLEESETNNPPEAEVSSTSDDVQNDEPVQVTEKKSRKKKKAQRIAMSPEQVAEHIVITSANKVYHGQRQLILDTETTGFFHANGDRIIEVGAIEMINRKLTGSSIHIYIQPEKEVGESVTVHGITDEFLLDKPIFSEVAHILYDYLRGAEIIAHNASFDMNFLDMEFEQVGLGKLSDVCSVTDTLAMAKAKHGGQRNSLDALVKRYEIPERDRTFHGALLDAEILADVYLAMTGGQVALDIVDSFSMTGQNLAEHYAPIQANLTVILPTDEELQAHQQWQQKADKKYPDELPSVFYRLQNQDWQVAYDERQAELKAEEEAKRLQEEQAKAEQEAKRLQEEQAQAEQDTQLQQSEPEITHTNTQENMQENTPIVMENMAEQS